MLSRKLSAMLLLYRCDSIAIFGRCFHSRAHVLAHVTCEKAGSLDPNVFFKMAERRDNKGACGFFYYDWAQSRYRWSSENHLTNFKVRKSVCSPSEAKVGGNHKKVILWKFYIADIEAKGGKNKC